MCPIHSEAKQTKSQSWEWRKVYCKGHTWWRGRLMLKRPELPKGFQESIFKDEGVESQGVWSAHEQFSDWLMVRSQGSVTRVNIINPQAPLGLGATCSWSSNRWPNYFWYSFLWGVVGWIMGSQRSSCPNPQDIKYVTLKDKLRVLRWKIVLNYLSEPNIIIRVT